MLLKKSSPVSSVTNCVCCTPTLSSGLTSTTLASTLPKTTNSSSSFTTTLRWSDKNKKVSCALGNNKLEYLIDVNMAFWTQRRWSQSDEDYPNFHSIKQAVRILKGIHKRVPCHTDDDLLQRSKLEFSITKAYLQLTASYSKFFKHNRAFAATKQALKYLSMLLDNSWSLLAKKSPGSDTGYSTTDPNTWTVDQNPVLKKQFMQFLEPTNNLIQLVVEVTDSIDQGITDSSFADRLDLLDTIKFELPMSKLEVSWVKDISIANFMHLEYARLESLDWKLSFPEFFSEAFLSFLIMLSAVVLFAMSTENRFVLQDFISGPKNNPFKIVPVFEKTQQLRIRKMKQFVFSEKTHSKAVCMLSFFASDNQLASHLAGSFQKNYQSIKDLQAIVS